MPRRWVAAVGAGVTFVAAGGAGAAGGLLGDSPLWAGLALAVTLLTGAGATVWVALRTADAAPDPPAGTDRVEHHGGTTFQGTVTAPGGQAAVVVHGNMIQYRPGGPP